MLQFSALVGSRCFGLELPDSDIDIVCVGDDGNRRIHAGPYHYIRRTEQELVESLTLQTRYHDGLQWMFPAEFLSNRELADYIVLHREELIRGNLASVWQRLWTNADGLSLHAEHYFNAFPKRIAYSTMRFDTLARYAAGCSFQEAFRPEPVLRELLLAIRKRQMPMEEALALNLEARQRAEAVQSFYNRPPDTRLQNQTASDIRGFLHLHDN